METLKLVGRALELKEAVFNKKVTKTLREWENSLYPDSSSLQSKKLMLYKLRKQLKSVGFPTIVVPMDLQDYASPRVLKPLLSSKKEALYFNRQREKIINSMVQSFQLDLYHELCEWPQLLPDILSSTNTTLELYASWKKNALSENRNTWTREIELLTDASVGGSKDT